MNKSSIGRRWSDVRKELYTPEEIAASDLRVAITGEIIKARKKQGVTQRKLEEMSGVKQPVIARLEKGETIPRMDTVMKLLTSLGKTLYVGNLKAKA